MDFPKKMITLRISSSFRMKHADNSSGRNLKLFYAGQVEGIRVRSEFVPFPSSAPVREDLVEIIYRMKRKLNVSPGKI